MFNGAQTSFSYAADRKQMQGLEKENARASAKTDVITALMSINTAKEVLATARKGIEAAKESYAMADKRYATNVGTITDLLDSQSRLTQAGADVSQALAEYHSTRAQFYYYMGQKDGNLCNN